MTPFERAEQAKQLLSNETLRRALADIREELIQKLETCGLNDVEGQHEIALLLQLRKQFISRLERYVQDGLLEVHKQQQQSFIDKQRERLSTVWRRG